MYFKSDIDGATLVGTHVDELLVTGTSNERVDVFFSQMAYLEPKDVGLAEKFLGMRVNYDFMSGTRLIQAVYY